MMRDVMAPRRPLKLQASKAAWPLASIYRAPAYLAPVIWAALMIAGALSPAMAADNKFAAKKNIGGKNINIGIPSDQCPMDPKNPADKLIIEGVQNSVKGSNDLLMQFANCKELKEWRTGKQKYLNNFGSYQTSVKLKAVDLAGSESATIREICNVFKKQGASILDNLKPEVNKRIEDSFGNIRLNEMKLIGIVHEDPTICAAATFQRLKTDDGSTKDQVNVYSVTILNGRILFTYLYAPYEGGDNVSKLTKSITDLNNYNQINNKK